MNDSKLPEEINFNFTASFNLINFDNSDILKSIRSLNVIKVHGDDDILVTIITMCDESLIKPGQWLLLLGTVLLLVFIQISGKI